MAWRPRFRMLSRSPRYLLIGPAGAGKTTLADAAVASASTPRDRRKEADRSRVGWHDVGRGVIIDVPGSLAFPSGDRDLGAWERLLRQLRRLRPRRPLDGIILAIPASLLQDSTRDEERVHLATAVRDRFALAQGLLGFTVPVYVVLTKADELRGFEAFRHTLSDKQSRNMLGWSNPHGTGQGVVGDWDAQRLDTLHDAIVTAQVERFASATRLENSADIFVFSGQVRQLEPNLRVLLEEVFRPSLYREAFYCRGFYLCGRSAHAPSSIAFLDDLLVNKVFAERGLATPLPDVAVHRARSRTIAQVVGAVLILALAAGIYWGDMRLRRAQSEVLNLLNKSSEILSERDDVRDGPITVKRRLEQSRGLLNDELRQLNNDWLSWVVLNAPLRKSLTQIFRHIVLDDFRAGLEDKARDWLRAAEPPPVDDPAPSGPDFQTRSRYQRLARFAQGYAPFVENYRRYQQFVLPDGTRDFGSLLELNTYLDGTSLKMQALGGHLTEALHNANAAAINCGIFEDVTPYKSRVSLVSRHASALLDDFREWSFGDGNPLQLAALNFKDAWTQLLTTDARWEDLDLLIADTDELALTADAWKAYGSRPVDERIALFEEQPFNPQPANTGLCPALAWPNLPDGIQQAQQLKRALWTKLLDVEVEPFGAIFTIRGPGLVLADAVIAFKKELDMLQQQSFWPPKNPPYATLPSLRPYATWRSEDVDDVVKTADAFATYKAHRTKALDDSSRDALFGVAEPEVSELLARRLLHTASEGPQFPADLAAMSQQVQVLGTVITRIRRIEPLLGRSKSGQDFLVSLDGQAAEALNRVDSDARRSFPWVFVWPRQPNLFDGLFTKWQHVRDAAPAADAANLAESTKRWEAEADSQRDAVLRYATLARPLADYLFERRKISEPVSRWTRIERDAASFEQKRPDTALSAFDGMMRAIPTINPANRCGERDAPAPPSSGEYFGPLRGELALAAARQCHQQVQDDYQAIARVFNDHLRGRFPFIDVAGSTLAERVDAAEGRPEATPEGVKALLNAYAKAQGPSLKRFLEDKSPTCSTDEALMFLNGVDVASTLLASAADPQLKTPAIVLDLRPVFRVAADPGTGGGQIAEWRLEVGSKAAREAVATTSEPLPWTTGNKVSVVVRFARDSPSVPSAGAGVPPRAGLDERTVRFDFSGDWALFRLLLARSITRPADVLGLRSREVPPQTVLAFQIPVQQASDKPRSNPAGQGSPFEVFMRLGIFARGKTEALPVGALPTRAPARVMCIS